MKWLIALDDRAFSYTSDAMFWYAGPVQLMRYWAGGWGLWIGPLLFNLDLNSPILVDLSWNPD